MLNSILEEQWDHYYLIIIIIINFNLSEFQFCHYSNTLIRWRIRILELLPYVGPTLCFQIPSSHTKPTILSYSLLLLLQYYSYHIYVLYIDLFYSKFKNMVNCTKILSFLSGSCEIFMNFKNLRLKV